MQGLEGDIDAILQVLSEIESLRIKGIYNLIETELGLLERYATECKGEVQVIEGVQALVSLSEEAVALCDDIRNHHGGGGHAAPSVPPPRGSHGMARQEAGSYVRAVRTARGQAPPPNRTAR